jgi:hypothetical protein
MLQTYYLHDGAHIERPPRRNNMDDSPGLSTIPPDAPLEGPDATALILRAELESAALLLRMAEIPVVSQEYHNGMYFYNRL